MQVILHLAILSVTIIALSRLNPGVHIKNTGAAIGVAVVFSVLNFLLGWLIRALLIVPAFFTFGLLFLFVPFIVNGVLLWLTDKVMDSFKIDSIRGLLVSAFVITAVNAVLQAAWFGSAVSRIHFV
ncbi:MAG TPA: phage holin family protein [Polyangiaceae bacterium]|jgi:putative membrane protein